MDNRFVFASDGHGGFPAFRNRFAMPGTNAYLWVARLPRPDRPARSRVLGTPAGMLSLLENLQLTPDWKKPRLFHQTFLTTIPCGNRGSGRLRPQR